MKQTTSGNQIPNVSSRDVMVPVVTTKSKVWLKPTDQIDTWLDSQGYYRKHIARDASSLFRCVSEKVFLSQIHHLTVRKHCIQFAINQPEVFSKLTAVPVREYIERLHNQREWGNTLDMEIISRLYKLDFTMYKEIKKPVEEITSNGHNSFVVLSLSYEHHYDSVYSKQHIINAAICQSILYEMLYKLVFKLEEVDYAVNKMLHDKTARYQNELDSTFFTTGFQMRLEMRDNCKNVKNLLNCGITPFPYKTAKALDPTIYRNVEYDTWNEQRRGVRHGLYVWNNSELKTGALCVVNFQEEGRTIQRHAYIQKMSSNNAPVEVYVMDLGERMFVPYESLELVPASATTDNNYSDNVINVPNNLSESNSKGKSGLKEESNFSNDVHSPGYSKKTDFSTVSDSCNVHYVHSTSATVPTTCYVCITSQNYQAEVNNENPVPNFNSNAKETSKNIYNVHSNNEINNPPEQSPMPTSVQYPAPVYSVMPPPLPQEVQHLNYPTNMYTKTESADINSSMRMYYNNGSDLYYRYGVQSVPYYVISPNYVYPITPEQQLTQNTTDVSKMSYIPTTYTTTQHPNDLVYTMPLSTTMNIKKDVPSYPPPIVTYPPTAYVKKTLRNISETDYSNNTDAQTPYRSYKDNTHIKESVLVNANSSVPQANTISTNMYPYYNNAYSTSPYYYHTYECNGSCYTVQTYSENIAQTPAAYQSPPVMPIAYSEDMYQTNTPVICQPMLPSGNHN